MRIEAHGPDGVRELRLFNPCRQCGYDINGFTIEYSPAGISKLYGFPDISALTYIQVEPCGHCYHLDGSEPVMYMYSDSTDGKKAYNAKAIELAREKHRKSTQAGDNGGLCLRDSSHS